MDRVIRHSQRYSWINIVYRTVPLLPHLPKKKNGSNARNNRRHPASFCSSRRRFVVLAASILCLIDYYQWYRWNFGMHWHSFSVPSGTTVSDFFNDESGRAYYAEIPHDYYCRQIHLYPRMWENGFNDIRWAWTLCLSLMNIATTFKILSFCSWSEPIFATKWSRVAILPYEFSQFRLRTGWCMILTGWWVDGLSTTTVCLFYSWYQVYYLFAPCIHSHSLRWD